MKLKKKTLHIILLDLDRILVARDSLHHDDTALVSIVGEDRFGGMLLDHMKKLDMRVDAIKTIKAKRTAVCNLMLDINGDLQTGIADMDIFKSLSGEMVRHNLSPTVNSEKPMFSMTGSETY